MRRTFYLLVIVFSAIISSCQQDETGISRTAEDAAREIGFVQIDSKSISTRSEILGDVSTDLGIKARIARKKQDVKQDLDFATSEH